MFVIGFDFFEVFEFNRNSVWYAHRRIWPHVMQDTAELNSSLDRTPRAKTPRWKRHRGDKLAEGREPQCRASCCPGHRGVKFCWVHLFTIYSTPGSFKKSVWNKWQFCVSDFELCSVQDTADSDSATGWTPLSQTTVHGEPWAGHRGVRFLILSRTKRSQSSDQRVRAKNLVASVHS